MVLNHIAKGIDTSNPEHQKNVADEIKSLLH